MQNIGYDEMGFKDFLINEEKNYLGTKVGYVVSAAQDLQGDMQNLGSRHLNRLAEKIVNQIRKILHGSWSPKQQNHLKGLQKIAIAIQKTIDDRGDLKEILPAATAELEKVSAALGAKVNNLDAPDEMEGEDISQNDFQLTGDGPAQPQQPQDNMGGGDPQANMGQASMPQDQQMPQETMPTNQQMAQ